MEIINTELMVIMRAYVNEWINLASLKEWLATRIWELLDSSSPLDRMTVGELQIAISEFDRGDRDEEYIKTVSKGLLFILNAVQHALDSPAEIVREMEIVRT